MADNNRQVPEQIICDFYNLHLESGRQCIERPDLSDAELITEGLRGQPVRMAVPGCPEEVRGEVWPDDNERKRILDLFETYCPEVVIHPDAQSFEKKRAEWLKKKSEKKGTFTQIGGDIDLSDTLAPTGHEPTADDASSLGGYEYLNKASWFESEDYLDFVDHWRNLRHLLDSVIAGQLDLHYLSRFRNDAIKWQSLQNDSQHHTEGYMQSVGLRDSKGKRISPQRMIGKGINTVDLSQWEVEATHTVEDLRYGVTIGIMLYEVHRCMIRAMGTPETLGQCVLPDCRNLFPVSHTGQGRPRSYFCSTPCWDRYKREYDKLYMKYVKRPRDKGECEKSGEWLKQEALKRLRRENKSVS